MPKVKIYYSDSSMKNKDVSILEVSYFLPESDRQRFRYFYYSEFKNIELLFGRFLKQETLHYSNGFGIFLGCDLHLTKEEFLKLLDSISERSICEEVKMKNNILGLTTMVNTRKQDPKFWNID